MKVSEVSVGGEYLAKVSGRLVTVRVIGTVERFGQDRNGKTHYIILNTATGRKLEFRSAARLRPIPAAKGEG